MMMASAPTAGHPDLQETLKASAFPKPRFDHGIGFACHCVVHSGDVLGPKGTSFSFEADQSNTALR